MSEIKSKDTVVAITETLKIESAVVAKPAVSSVQRSLSNNEMSPANWNVTGLSDGTVEAFCGSLKFVGTAPEFSAMLRSGKIAV